MNVTDLVTNTLHSFVASGADKQEVINACKSWSRGDASTAPTVQPTGYEETNLMHVFRQYFPDLETPETAFFPKVITAAEGNEETATAVFDILRQGRERGEWRDESFPAGLVFWFLKNKEHDRLRKQGYAIRKQREAAEAAQTEDEAPAAHPPMPKPAPVETAAYQPSGEGLAKLQAAIKGFGKAG